MAETEAVTRRFDKLLQRQNIRCIAMTRNSPPGLPDQVSPDLIIAIDEFGVHQAQILKSQRAQQRCQLYI